MNIHYVYYSYEEFGRGYIGCRTSSCSPEDDDYLGSYHDKTFNPTHKIILETFSTREETLRAEIKLHEFYQVDKNPHFANKSKQKTTGFYYSPKGVVRTEEYKKKMSERLKGREITWAEKIKSNMKPRFGECNSFYGKTHSEKTRNQISKSLKQYHLENPQAHPFLDKTHTEETKQKMGENNKGSGNPNFGKKQSEETKEKVRLSKVGKRWWSNQIEEKFCKECPGKGWELGRKKTR